MQQYLGTTECTVATWTTHV